MKNVYRKFFAAIICLSLLFIFCSCQNEQDAIYGNALAEVSSQEEPESAEDSFTGELVIMADERMGELSWGSRIDEFNKLYPDVSVVFNDVGDEFESMSVAIMSGEAGDIVDLMNMPFFKYAQSGLFVDLYPYFEKDEAFNLDDFYSNVFAANECDGKLYAFPRQFSYTCFRLNEELLSGVSSPDKFEELSYKDIAKLYDDVRRERGDGYFISNSHGVNMFDSLEFSAYLDEQNRTADFDSPAFIEYLETIAKLDFPQEEFSDYWGYPLMLDSANPKLDETQLCRYLTSRYFDASNAESLMEGNTYSLPIIAATSDGKYPITQLSAAITQESENKDLAYEFLTFLEKDASRKIGIYDSYYSISRNQTRKSLEAALGTDNQEIIDRIEAMNNSANVLGYEVGNMELYIALDEILLQYRNGIMSAEQCAEEMQNRAEIYIKE